MTTHSINASIQPSGNSKKGQANDDRAANWEDLANTLQEKTNKRLDDINLIVSRASITIAAIAFLIPCLLEQGLSAFLLVVAAIPIVVSFIYMTVSIFIVTPVPIKPDEAVSMLESEKHRDMSREEFSKWKARSYSVGLQGFNEAYEKKRHYQLISFIALGLAIILLVLFKCITIDTNMSKNTPPRAPSTPQPSIEYQKFGCKLVQPPSPCSPPPSIEYEKKGID